MPGLARRPGLRHLKRRRLLIALCLPAEAPEPIRELVDWFKSAYEAPGGDELPGTWPGGDESTHRCQKMLIDTYGKMADLLEERGCRFGTD